MASQELNFNIFNIIILIGIFQGFVFCFIVFFNNNYKIPSNYFLVFTALALSLNNLQYLVIDIELVEMLYYQFPFEFLIMPMFYIFVDKYLSIKSTKKVIFLILIPFLFGLVFRLIVKLNLEHLSEDVIHVLLTIEEYLSLVFSILMIVIILFKIHNYEKSKLAFDLTELKAKTKWLKQALIIGVIVCISWLIVIKESIARFEKDLSTYYPLWIIISVLVYWIVYKGLIETRVLNQRMGIRNDILKSLPSKPKSLQINDNLFLEIENEIVSKKLYLNPNLNLELIAEKFGISVSYLSKLVNSSANQSFTDFINKLRIEEAKKMLINPDFKNYTIEAVGYESGFNSKSNFYAAFKKETQKTPSSFRSNQ